MNYPAARFVAVALVVAACNRPAGGGDPPSAAPRAWIDRPLEGSEFLLGDTIPIVWHASGDDGLRRVEVLIDGELLEAFDDLDPDLILADGEAEWTPAEAGEHLIEVIATGPDDAVGPPAENVVTVFAEGGSVAGAAFSDLNGDGDSSDEGEGPLADVLVAVNECGEQQSMVTGANGAFRFDDLPLDPCRIDFLKGGGWSLTSTFPAGLDLPIHFTPNPELEANFSVRFTPWPTPTPRPTATLALATTVPVVPVVTPIPPLDDVPPPKPRILSPEGVMLECLDDVVLRWEGVTDPSGINWYNIELKVDTGGSNFVGVATYRQDGPIPLDITDQTDCGNLYGWSVRAEDHAGNIGEADFALFSIALP